MSLKRFIKADDDLCTGKKRKRASCDLWAGLGCSVAVAAQKSVIASDGPTRPVKAKKDASTVHLLK